MVKADQKPSRRFFLGTIGTGLTFLSGCSFNRRRLSNQFIAPRENSWPLERYDTKNSGHNSNAVITKNDPKITSSIEVGFAIFSIVVSNPYLAVSGASGTKTYHHDNLIAESQRVTSPSFLPGNSMDNELYYASNPNREDRSSIVGTALSNGEIEIFFESDRYNVKFEYLSITDDLLLAGSKNSNTFYVIQRRTGDLHWSGTGSFPVLSDNRVYATGPSGVWCYEIEPDLFETNRKWSANTSTQELYPPAVSNNSLLFGSFGRAIESGQLFSINAVNGEQKWKPLELGNNVTSPAIVGERGFVGYTNDNNTGGIISVDILSGDILWEEKMAFWSDAPVIAGNNIVLSYGGRYDGKYRGVLQAHKLETGERLWQRYFSSPVQTVVPVADRMYVGTEAGKLLILN